MRVACHNTDKSDTSCFLCTGVTALYLEATLPPEYPEQSIPEFSLGNLNNSHWSANLKQEIFCSLQEQVRYALPGSMQTEYNLCWEDAMHNCRLLASYLHCNEKCCQQQ